MICIRIEFTAGRYHATAWGRHVNEGTVDWPPAPWRILRALIAVWYRKRPDLPTAAVRECILGLAAVAPEYSLPPGRPTHSRHFMPLYRTDLRKTAKIFDGFLEFGPQAALLIRWPGVELSANATSALAGLLGALSYLGRAESWVEASLVEDAIPDIDWNASPLAFGAEPPAGHEVEHVLLPMAPDDYVAWRASAKQALFSDAVVSRQEELRRKAQPGGNEADVPEIKPSQLKKIEASVEALLPVDVFEAIQAETLDLHKVGWNAPPASRTIMYQRPKAAWSTSIGHQAASDEIAGPASAVFAIVADTLGADTRPRLVETILLADQFRRSLMSQSCRLAEERGDPEPNADPLFSGRDGDGLPSRDHHAHVFILPQDRDGDGRIDTIVVHSRLGFQQHQLASMLRVKRLWQHGGRPGLRVVWLGLDTTGGEAPQHRERRPGAASGNVAHLWESRTPFVLNRHPKRHKDGRPKLDDTGAWIDGPEEQVRRELQRHGFPEPREVVCLDDGRRWRSFERFRSGGGRVAAGTPAFGFRISFDQAVRGPIALGYGCHYGLGQFAPGYEAGAVTAPRDA